MSAADLQAVIRNTIQHDSFAVFGYQNLHGVYLHHRDPEMRRFYAYAHYVFIDGMPLVWLGRLLGYPLRRQHRCTALDWLPTVFAEAAVEGWRVFYFGSAPGVAERGAELLRERYRGLKLKTAHGYCMNCDAEERVLAAIQAYRPQVLCVGMGMPKQERWILKYGQRSTANVVISVGGLIDWLAGELWICPRWVGPTGFEWLSRLVTSPRRVWYRYLVEPWSLLPLLARDLARIGKRLL
jgi:N-acetylglucosaminyldiphosphoundecaprenol N-acetyl-beta-D-mannosaminyltransferase